MNNIFQIGGQVSGESFIGREKLLTSFVRDYSNKEGRSAKAIVGLTRIGKSSFAMQLMKKLPEDILKIYVDLNEASNYAELWQIIYLDICDELKSNKLFWNDDIEQEIREAAELFTDNTPWIKFSRGIKRFFESLKNYGIKVFLTLDEFDNAQTLFTDGTKHFELFRTIFSDARYDVSTLIISRRSIYMIEGATYQSSTFHGVLDIIHFAGFDDNDLAEYFNKYQELGISLSDMEKRDILYYGGNSPYLLSIIGHYIVENVQEGRDVDVAQIVKNKCKAINDYFRDVLKHLERDDDLKRLVAFIIGPKVNVTVDDRDELENMGYLSLQDGHYLSISEYFTSFFSNSEQNISIWDNLIGVEKKIKSLLENEMANLINHFQVQADSINEIEAQIILKTPFISTGDKIRYDKFLTSTKRDYNIDSTYFAVMSLKDAFKIIAECWSDIFAKYFGDSLYGEWEGKFEKCGSARNPVAHGHEEYLTDNEKAEVDVYCKEIMEEIQKNERNIKPSRFSENEIIKGTRQKFDAVDHESIKLDPALIGTIVEFKITGKGGKSKQNLRGIVNGKYGGVIPKNYLEGVELDSLVGSTIQLPVEKIIEASNLYQLYYETFP